MGEYLSITEVAKKLNVNHQVVRTLVLGGHLKATKVGKQYRILDSDLEDFIRINTVKSGNN